MEAAVEKYQKQLLEQAQYVFYENPISEATQKAYLATPRHLFVKRYREWGTKGWREVTQDNLEEHVATLYADTALILFGEDDENVPSTISQPSFVLRMLDLLHIEPGHTVFELGAGSGWNAALMGHLVGPEGLIYSLEIIPDVAQMATETIERLGVKNVRIIEADGGEGYAAGAPYDRAIFTAGAYDFPHRFFEQMKEDGLLLIVIKNEGGGDHLFLLRKTTDHFMSLEAMACGFVPMTGKYQSDDLEPMVLETLSEWSKLKQQELAKRSFWWGGKGKDGFRWRTLGIRSFLGITEPFFQTFKTERTDERSPEEHYFGLWDKENHSLVIAKDDWLTSYGNSKAEDRLMQDVRQWVDLGMPSAASFELKIYPIDVPIAVRENQWLVKRNKSQFLWGLKI
jgi:protein-L-isoaspartate(D-aspartate) O-methyltransferase